MKKIAEKGLDGTPGEFLPVESVTKRWGKASSAGFTAVPNALIHAQADLGLTANDMIVILNLLSHWWYTRRTPFPSPTLIAKRSGLGIRSVQRSLKRLRDLGLMKALTRPEGGTRYELNGLVTAVEERAQNHAWRMGRAEQRIKAPTTDFDDRRFFE